MNMSNYQPRITKQSDGEFYALIVHIDKNGRENVIRGYKDRTFKTMKAAEKSVNAYISNL
jgi:hypothetical protein